jgi:hypothetical protein
MNQEPDLPIFIAHMRWRDEFSMMGAAIALVSVDLLCIFLARQWLEHKQRREAAGLSGSKPVFDAQIFYNRVRTSFAVVLLLAFAIVVFAIARLQDPTQTTVPSYQTE